MSKLTLLFVTSFFFTITLKVSAQQSVWVNYVFYDSVVNQQALQLPQQFSNRDSATGYINRLPVILQAKGYFTAAVDSTKLLQDTAWVFVYTGALYKWGKINYNNVDSNAIKQLSKTASLSENSPGYLQWLQNNILSWYENNGFPFARIKVDSVHLGSHNQLTAAIVVDKGPASVFGGIRQPEEVVISQKFLTRYLDLSPGSVYNRKKTEEVMAKLRALNYLEEAYPAKVKWEASTAWLDLYLKKKRSNVANVLIGFLPTKDIYGVNKFMVTGEAQLQLNNELGQGESFSFYWQQLQPKAPRLMISYKHPYIFNLGAGFLLDFQLYKRDSTYTNILMNIGSQFIINKNARGSLLAERTQTLVSLVDTNYIIQNYRLPDAADVTANTLGIFYELNRTNYYRNPVKGVLLTINGGVGLRNIKKNNAVLNLKDPQNPAFNFASLYDTVTLKSVQIKYTVGLNKFFPLSPKQTSTLKTAVHSGLIYNNRLFINELFQIGGFKLLRGFDEESQFVSQYIVGTVEYRYLIAQNSYLYAFSDGGWAKNAAVKPSLVYWYLSGGAGMAFETKAGVINLAWAIGKRNDIPFNLRQSKIHFGFVSYF